MTNRHRIRSLHIDRSRAHTDIRAATYKGAMAFARRLIPARPDCAIVIVDPAGDTVWGHYPDTHHIPADPTATRVDDSGPEWGPPDFCLQVR